MGYVVARGRLLVGDTYREVGDPVPEAATWTNLDAYIAAGLIAGTADPGVERVFAARINVLEEQLAVATSALSAANAERGAADAPLLARIAALEAAVNVTETENTTLLAQVDTLRGDLSAARHARAVPAVASSSAEPSAHTDGAEEPSPDGAPTDSAPAKAQTANPSAEDKARGGKKGK